MTGPGCVIGQHHHPGACRENPNHQPPIEHGRVADLRCRLPGQTALLDRLVEDRTVEVREVLERGLADHLALASAHVLQVHRVAELDDVPLVDVDDRLAGLLHQVAQIDGLELVRYGLVG